LFLLLSFSLRLRKKKIKRKKSSEERVRAAASSSSAFAAKVWITSCDASIAKCAQDQKQQRRSDAGEKNATQHSFAC